MKQKRDNKPIVETILNTAALALTATGTNFLIGKDIFGFLLIIFGAGLEFFKYWGRKNKYW